MDPLSSIRDDKISWSHSSPSTNASIHKINNQDSTGLDQKELMGLWRVLLAYFPGRHTLISFGNTFTQRLVQQLSWSQDLMWKNLSQRDYKQQLGADSPVRQAEISCQGLGGKEDSQVLGMAVVA